MDGRQRESEPGSGKSNPDLPKPLSNLIVRMLSKKVGDRPASLEEVAHELELILAGKVAITTPRGTRIRSRAIRA